MPSINGATLASENGDFLRDKQDVYSNMTGLNNRLKSEIPYSNASHHGGEMELSTISNVDGQSNMLGGPASAHSKIDHPASVNPYQKGVKVLTPFSPKTFSRLAAVQTNAKNYEQSSGKKKASKLSLKKHFNSIGPDHNSSRMIQLSDEGDQSTSRNNYQERNLSRHTFQIGQSSFTQLLKVDPSWVALKQNKAVNRDVSAGNI